ncbi:MAG: alcohol dehydrogenase catalytic domain-containing protein [Acidaminococcus sp.]|jgi:threonine 3-dehydrogenase|nr:alcohol dehydrogenase catalytic domain-containing protein [Acidaminococcus sp.]MCI2099611.1 alcohol dehydrogenase catalytic domain-containing protein [Acidaminococcus sp.]MCI2113696.1 alcohol dehydrogenase catalytic domain-containing protein [Acidaminococcus sp.]MCI2115779.1 alcohol dehydrogenase catalytic domain-containing protein [Acidaminococcus sp.]
MQGTMCGLVKKEVGPGKFVYRTDLPIPQVGDDEVLIKVHCSAICGTDFHIMDWDTWSQMRVHPPLIPGHETAGDIVAVGKNVTERKVGDRVSCESHISCGECWFCKHDMKNICTNTKIFGVSQDGAFAEYAKIRWDATFLLDDDISYEAACMFEPMGAGVHGVEKADVPGHTVLVSGCGPIGLTAIAACKTFGASKVIACDLIDEKLEVAKEMGADYVFNSAKVDLPKEVKELTNGMGVDRVVDITGSGKAINTDLKCLRAAGRLVCVGLPSKPVTIEDMTDDLIYREIELTGISGRKIWETWTDFAKVMKGPYWKLDRVIGGRYALSDFDSAVSAVESGVPGKMLLYPHMPEK